MSNIYYWFLHGCRPQPGKDIIGNDPEKEAYRKSIGNWFATEEEAVKARKKLEALKRLIEKGFKFDGWSWYPSSIKGMEIISIRANMDIQTDFKNNKSYLDLLFGGEE